VTLVAQARICVRPVLGPDDAVLVRVSYHQPPQPVAEPGTVLGRWRQPRGLVSVTLHDPVAPAPVLAASAGCSAAADEPRHWTEYG